MAIVLGTNPYGTSENRVVRIDRDTPRHENHGLDPGRSSVGCLGLV